MSLSLMLLNGTRHWEPDLPIYLNRVEESYILSMHTHDFIEISYIKEGRGIHYINGVQLHVEPGDLFVIAIGTAHIFRPLSVNQDEKFTVINCDFERNYINRFCSSLPNASAIEQLFHLDSYDYRYYKKQQNELGPLIENLYMEYTLHLPEYQLLLHTQLIYLISILYRYESQGVTHTTTRNKLEAVFQHIHTCYNENIRIEELASMVPVSVTHLQRLLKQIVGQSFTEYQQTLRINKSCELLRITSKSIREISTMVGYNDLTFFHALFKKKMGTSPLQYRKLQGE